MLRVDGRVLVGSVALVFLLGAGIGFAVAGTVGGTAGDASPVSGASTPTPEPVPAETAAVTPTPTVVATGSPTLTPTPAGTVTTAPPSSPTSVPTSTVTTESTVSPTATPPATRTPMLVRRFEVSEIESEIRRLVNEWRDEQGLSPFAVPDGRLVGDLNAMARSHSVAMADAGEVAHTIDNSSSVDRYHEFDLYWNCRFKRANHDYIVSPERNSLEVLAQTYAGRAYTTADGETEYNADETAVARDVVETWTSDPTFRERLSYRNVTRIGVGVETTRDNEVYVTGNLCGVRPRTPEGANE
jgi:uncharacterized protein YkwD